MPIDPERTPVFLAVLAAVGCGGLFLGVAREEKREQRAIFNTFTKN